MKKYLVSTLTLVAVLGSSVAPALASEGSGIRGFLEKFRSERKDDRSELRDKLRDERGELRDDTASKSAQLSLKHEADRRDRITKFWRKTGERLQRLINLEKNMADKIEKRLQKLENAGKNVSAQKALLVTARTKIAQAQTALNDATTQISALVVANKPVEALAKARELHKGVVAKIRVAHRALVDVVVSTRGMSATPTPTPTPTP